MPRAGGLANFPLEELGKAVVDLAAAVNTPWEEGYWCATCKRHFHKWEYQDEGKYHCRKCMAKFDDAPVSVLIRTSMDKSANCPDVFDDQQRLERKVNAMKEQRKNHEKQVSK